jgi:putative DNA primase/helicase
MIQPPFTPERSGEPEIGRSNAELDAILLANDKKSESKHLIARLLALPPIERAREMREVAKELNVPIAAVKEALKEATAKNDTKGQGRPLELPEIELWPDPVDGAKLLHELCDALGEYLVLPSDGVEILALWALHTHAFENFAHSPRLAITSPEKGCGKTTTLDVLGELVARPLPTSNASVAAVFRIIEMVAPTLLIDEADTFLKENDELRGILNTGHRRGGQVTRTVGDDHEPRQFSTWAPVAIAMIGRLPDTLEDRAIALRLRRKKPTERVRHFRSDQTADLKQLARMMARWTADNRDALAASDPDMGALFNRAADNWRPLIAIADQADGDWPARVRAIAETSEGSKEDQSTRTMLLSDIRDVLAARPYATRIGSTELATELGMMEGRPWAEWRHGKQITAAGLARMLAPFGISPATRRDGAETFKGYLAADFEEAFARYLGDQTVTASQPNNHGHCDALQSVTPEKLVTSAEASRPNNHGPCDVVTFQKGPADVCAHCQQPETPAHPLLEVGIDGYCVRLHRGCMGGYDPVLNNGGNSR